MQKTNFGTSHRLTQLIAVWVLVLFASAAFSSVALAQTTGLSVMEEQKRRHDVPKEFSEKTMQLHSAKGKVKNRRMVDYSISPPSGENKTLIKFLEPASINNVGLLTWEQPQTNDDDQWLYLPASKKIRRISGGGKSNPFMGTDFSFEDMRPENLSTHNYKIVTEEELDGHLCWVIEATPSTAKEKKASGYAKRLFWVRQDIHFTVKVEFYDRRNKLSKVGLYQNLEEVNDGVWRANEVSMENIKRKTKTILQTLTRDLNNPMSASLFETQALKRPPASH